MLATYTKSGGTGHTAVDQDEAVALMQEKYGLGRGQPHLTCRILAPSMPLSTYSRHPVSGLMWRMFQRKFQLLVREGHNSFDEAHNFLRYSVHETPPSSEFVGRDLNLFPVPFRYVVGRHLQPHIYLYGIAPNVYDAFFPCYVVEDHAEELGFHVAADVAGARIGPDVSDQLAYVDLRRLTGHNTDHTLPAARRFPRLDGPRNGACSVTTV